MSDHDDMDDGNGGEHRDRKEGGDHRLAAFRRNAQWTERYRPSRVEDLILPRRISDLLEGVIRERRFPHLLFAGPAGTGKTTAARALCKSVGVDDYVINASLDRGIDVVRNQIIPFASCYSFSGAGKVVVLEEADSLTDEAQRGLRAPMEEYAKNCAFIFICNEPERIIQPLHSRCVNIDFAPRPAEVGQLRAECQARMRQILEAEGVEYGPKAVAEIVDQHFPDFRQITHELQGLAARGRIADGVASVVALSAAPPLGGGGPSAIGTVNGEQNTHTVPSYRSLTLVAAERVAPPNGPTGVLHTDVAITGNAMTLDEVVDQESPIPSEPATVADDGEREQLLEPHAGTAKQFISAGRFIMAESGLWALDDHGAGWVCSALEVLARGRNPRGDGWCSLLRWEDDDGRSHRLLVTDADVQRCFSQVRGKLAGGGLHIEAEASPLLRQYLNSVRVPGRFTTVSRTGWHGLPGGRVFVLPTEAIASAGMEPVMFTGAEAEEANCYNSRGTLEAWRNGVAARVHGHTRPMLATSAAFAGALLEFLDWEGGGVHFYGRSSIGKTSVCVAAPASVWGKGDPTGYVRTWRSTANALEAVAANATDTLLPLDEIGLGDPQETGTIVYQLASGVGKSRAKSDGSLSARRSWRVMMISTGELPMAAKLAERGGKARAGQLVRMLDIPADAGRGFGVFDHGGRDGNPSSLADTIKVAACSTYGTAGPAFVRRLVAEDEERVRQTIIDTVAAFKKDNVPDGADGQVQRAADRFALVAAAGELAIEFGVLPWNPGDANDAAERVFEAWVDGRGGIEPEEVRQALTQVRRFFEENGDSRFQPVDAAKDAPPVARRAGWSRGNGATRSWLVLPQVWKEEVCEGLDATETARILADRGVLRRDANGGKFARSERTPDGTKRVYVVTAAIFTPGDDSVSDGDGGSA
jgi:uncharacterized protein (DUF927 family)